MGKMSDIKFDLEVIARGACIDTLDDRSFLIETFTLRLNWVALNAWSSALVMNCRDVYEDGAEGDKQWNDYQDQKRISMANWRDKACTAVGIENLNNVVITQNLSDIFTIVRITRISA